MLKVLLASLDMDNWLIYALLQLLPPKSLVSYFAVGKLVTARSKLRL